MDGSMALFPLSDGSAVIGKRWTPEGTIAEVKYVPEAQPPKQDTQSFEGTVLSRLDSIEDAISSLSQQPKRQARRSKGVEDAES